MKRVLVTGAGGFVGKFCLRELARRGFEIHAAARSKGQGSATVDWHAADLLSEAGISELVGAVKPTHLIHLAWCTKPGEYWSSTENVAWLAAGKYLLAQFVEAGGVAAVVAGTCAEYEWIEGRLSEGAVLKPSTLYGKCKKELYEYADSLARKHGITVGWGRLFFLYGPGEKRERLVASAILSLLDRREFKCTRGDQERDFLHVADAAAGLVALLENGFSGACNIASGTAVSVAAVVQTIARLLGRPDLLRLGALVSPTGEPTRLIADTELMRSTIGFAPSFNLAAGIADTIDWWKKNRAGGML